MRLYDLIKDSSGNRLKIADDVKISALEDMVPTELETHMQLNSDRIHDIRRHVRGDHHLH